MEIPNVENDILSVPEKVRVSTINEINATCEEPKATL